MPYRWGFPVDLRSSPRRFRYLRACWNACGSLRIVGDRNLALGIPIKSGMQAICTYGSVRGGDGLTVVPTATNLGAPTSLKSSVLHSVYPLLYPLCEGRSRE